MNFHNFYKDVEKRITDSILSLWASGDPETQRYFRHIFQEEKLLAEPVFQTTFPWESSTSKFGELNNIFNQNFINSLHQITDEEFRFPKERLPYKHQIESWKSLLNENKSIVVTTGTGSGKTECFMLPVLYDIYNNYRNTEGVNAIFLYPLNALISSQKKRMHEWTKSLKGIRYAVYNGKTPETTSYGAQNQSFPEILSRKDIRNSPPNVIFTNPTMLEYMLVRKNDVNILTKSKGKLKWILLDEAHTLNGTKATEMALLIRRVLDAFGVEPKDIRFAATSATVGNDSDSEKLLEEFMSLLTGQGIDQIKIISGKRVLPIIPDSIGEIASYSDIKNLNHDQLWKFSNVHDVRKKILKSNSLTLSEIGNSFNLNQLEDKLDLVDRLSEAKIDNNSIFPVRGHFFVRGIQGVFVCTNPKCEKHNSLTISESVGTLTIIASKLCNFCSYPLLELTSCNSCGNYLFNGEKINNPSNHKDYVCIDSNSIKDPFYMDDENSDEDKDYSNEIENSSNFVVAKFFNNKRYFSNNSVNSERFDIGNDGLILPPSLTGNFIATTNRGIYVCPFCGENVSNLIHFRISSSFLNRVLSDIILNAMPNSRGTLWQGRKYISFTDSRQGTAKVSAKINNDNERNWVQSFVFHSLSEKLKNSKIGNLNLKVEDIEAKIIELEKTINNAPPILRPIIEEKIIQLRQQMNPGIEESRMSWKDLIDSLDLREESRVLFRRLNENRSTFNENDQKLYLIALFFDQFARRLPRQMSLENLGLVNIVFDKYDSLTVPDRVKNLPFGIDLNDWKSLIKISIDYYIRYNFHIFLPSDLKKYSTSFLNSFPIFSIDESNTNSKKSLFPRFKKSNLRQNRLSLLICAGLGFHSIDEINTTDEDNIDILIKEIWETLERNILTKDGDNESGFKLNVESNFKFELTDKLWLCPVKGRLIDRHFRGFSPWISGNLTPENIQYFKVGDSMKFPHYPYPFGKDQDGEFVNQVKVNDWINEKFAFLRERGLWNDLYERIISKTPLFLAGEHSAQQSHDRLKKLEFRFENGDINILSCSTTMEMGVDIGGISGVVMNNVPPSPANYLQRAGRAGRRSESKSLALTICASNPIGLNIMDDPLWVLHHKIAAPVLLFNSNNIAERHINAYFLGKFIQSLDGINLTENVRGFFFDNPAVAENFDSWLANINLSTLHEGLNNLKFKTPLSSKPNSVLLDIVKGNLKRIIQSAILKYNNFEKALNHTKALYGNQNTPAFRAINYQFQQFLEKSIISYLAEERFISGAVIPTGVVSFDTINIDDLNNQQFRSLRPNPSYHITRALTEFAPGNYIIADGLKYKSSGILLKNEWNESRRSIIQSCSNCGFQRVIDVENEQSIESICPQCKLDSFYGLKIRGKNRPTHRFTELIEPIGFSVDLYDKPTRNISVFFKSGYLEPILIGVQPWTIEANSVYEVRDSNDSAEILYYNNGHGSGYSVCLYCGKTAFESDDLNDHRRLRGGKHKTGEDITNICTGNANHGFGIKHNVILGGRFKTDFCELRFRFDNSYSNDDSLLWTLGVVLTKSLAIFLGIEEADLSFGIKRYESYKSLFIFDNAIGGAGYSIKFSYYAEEIFSEALKMLEQCVCKVACTKCLIDKESQWHITKLDRHIAIKWLKDAISQVVPEELSFEVPNLKLVLGTVTEDIRRINYHNKIQRIWFYVDNRVGNWDLENAIIINDFKRNFENQICFVLNSPLEFSDDIQNRITAIQTSHWAKFFIDSNDYNRLQPVCQIQLSDNSFVIYYSEKFDNSVNAKWGISGDGNVFKSTTNVNLSLNELDNLATIAAYDNIDFYFNTSCVFSSDNLAKLFLKGIEDEHKLPLRSLMQGKSYDVVYSDRYLKSPFSNLLLIQFIKGLAKELKIFIASLTINVEGFNNYQNPKRIYHNYFNSQDRDSELRKIAKINGLNNISIQTQNLPHYRFLQFKGENGSLLIRPDGGIEHGWHVNGSEFYNGLSGEEQISIRKGVNYPILYSVIINLS